MSFKQIYASCTPMFLECLLTDPRIVPEARLIKCISFNELLEMTASGCPKPAMRAVELARSCNVRLTVRSAFTWRNGTTVTREESMESAIVSSVTHNTGEAKITVSGIADKPGIAGQLFRTLANQNVVVDMIVQNVSHQGITDISFTVPVEQLELTRSALASLKDDLNIAAIHDDVDIARVSLIGAGMRTNPGVAAMLFETLANEGINIEMISTSAIRISCVIKAESVRHAVSILHTAFELHKPPHERSTAFICGGV